MDWSLSKIIVVFAVHIVHIVVDDLAGEITALQ